MKQTIYFVNESPDFNFMLENGRMERIAANRVALSIMTEYGLANDRRMSIGEFSRFIESIQIITGTINEKKEDIRKRHYKKKKSVTTTVEPIRLTTLVDPITRETLVESVA